MSAKQKKNDNLITNRINYNNVVIFLKITCYCITLVNMIS